MLKMTLLANAASCSLFGFIFVFAAKATVQFIGTPPAILVQVLGFGLLINAAFIILTVSRFIEMRLPILIFSIADAIWVAATLILVLSKIWITNDPAIISALGVAVYVGICGWLQMHHLPQKA